jgi:ubiquinone/menaquinone biosynthesis C-methylase UbiE
VCPWWLGYFLASPVRRLRQDPMRILRPFVQEGMTVVEPGCGMGFFTLDLARLVGSTGRVVAVDLQPRMLAGLARRARKAGLADRIEARLAMRQSLGIDDLGGSADFVLAFAVVHELPDQVPFFADMYAVLKPGGRMLLAEPRGHVSDAGFASTIACATRAGFAASPGPSIRRSRSAVLERQAPVPA